MTKYIINSGAVSFYPDKFKIFVEELLKGLPKNPKLLLCFFAQKREDWEVKYYEKKQNLLDNISGNIKPSFEMAMPDKFIEQVKNTNAIIIYGGDDNLVQYWLKQFDLPSIWQNKTVSVSSASSNALAKHFWTCDWRQIMDGLGILPIKVIPHYKSDYGANDPRGPIDWHKAYKELPIYALEEGEFIVIRK